MAQRDLRAVVMDLRALDVATYYGAFSWGFHILQRTRLLAEAKAVAPDILGGV